MGIRALYLELVKPVSESWDEAGPTLRLLANATPKLLRAAYDARVAGAVCGRDALKAAVAPDVKATSQEGLAYQASLREAERLREWGTKKRNRYASLDVPGGMSSAIARAASQAFSRRDQGRVRFESERILVRKQECALSRNGRDVFLGVKLRTKGRVRFLVAGSHGAHRKTLDAIVSGDLPHGDCKIHYDARRKKWFAHVSYDAPDAAPQTVDPRRALIVHRGIRNALYMLPSTGNRPIRLGGEKYLAQRRKLQARMRNTRSISPVELGDGAKGRGKKRRLEHLGALEGKLSRATKTFCQQAGARVAQVAAANGFGLVVIEDYGGIEPNEDATLRRVLDRFPLYQLKESIAHACKKAGVAVQEASSSYISSTCPACENADEKQHNTRTDVFHCKRCSFERPADWVASYWMMRHAGIDTAAIDESLKRQASLAKQLKGTG